MATLYKRATPAQARILRIVEGAVKNAADAHPDLEVSTRFARSVAKRAAGTLTAQWPDVLAAGNAPSETVAVVNLGPTQSVRSLIAGKASERRPSHRARWSPLSVIIKKLSISAGEARRAGDLPRLGVLIEVLRIVDAAKNQS